MFTVKQAATILNLTEHTIRYYTDCGLVPSIERDKNNIRLFNEDSINWLTGVKYLKETGMSIEDIKTYVDLCLEGNSTIEARYNIILKQKAMAESQLVEAQKRLNYLNAKAAHYLEIVENRIPDDTNPNDWKEVDSIKKKFN